MLSRHFGKGLFICKESGKMAIPMYSNDTASRIGSGRPVSQTLVILYYYGKLFKHPINLLKQCYLRFLGCLLRCGLDGSRNADPFSRACINPSNTPVSPAASRSIFLFFWTLAASFFWRSVSYWRKYEISNNNKKTRQRIGLTFPVVLLTRL